MERLTKEFEIEIGVIRYVFEIEFSFYEGKSALDPTEQEDAELAGWDFDGPINAWDMEEEIGYTVENDREVEMIWSRIDIDELFYQAIS